MDASRTVGPQARRALWGSAVGYALVGFDLLIVVFLLRPISASLGLSPSLGDSLVSATLLGAVLG
ncbi:MAG: MFS transporter, partial [Acetobacteraceae bacterium]